MTTAANVAADAAVAALDPAVRPSVASGLHSSLPLVPPWCLRSGGAGHGSLGYEISGLQLARVGRQWFGVLAVAATHSEASSGCHSIGTVSIQGAAMYCSETLSADAAINRSENFFSLVLSAEWMTSLRDTTASS